MVGLEDSSSYKVPNNGKDPKMNRKQEIQKAREIDTHLAELWTVYYDLNDKITAAHKAIENADRVLSYRGTREFERERLEARIARQQAVIEELKPQRDAAAKTAADYDEANYTGWNRFFLVQHIHNTRYCSSFRPTTRVGWLPSVSGLTEAEAVAEHGATLCTICFPSAPVELTAAKVDPNICEGSGKLYSTEYTTGRERSYRGAAGYCPVCLRWQGVTSTGKMRKHKKDDETRRHALDPR